MLSKFHESVFRERKYVSNDVGGVRIPLSVLYPAADVGSIKIIYLNDLIPESVHSSQSDLHQVSEDMLTLHSI